MGRFNEVMKAFVNGFVAGVSDNGSVPASRQGVAAVERLCRELGWSVDERVGATGIVLHFRDPLVNIRPVMVSCGERIAGISTFSSADLPAGRVPAEVLGYLLQRNNELTAGAWRIPNADDGKVSFVVAYYALIGGLDSATFKFICDLQVKEAHIFDSKMQAAGLLRN